MPLAKQQPAGSSPPRRFVVCPNCFLFANKQLNGIKWMVNRGSESDNPVLQAMEKMWRAFLITGMLSLHSFSDSSFLTFKLENRKNGKTYEKGFSFILN